MSNNFKNRIFTSLALIFLAFIIFNSSFFLLYSLIVLSVFSIIEFLNLTQKIFKNKFFKILLNSFFVFIVIIVSYTFFIFSNNNVSKILLISLLIACIASDIGGYVIGKLFKGPKLTKISPNKTFSGAIGSLVFSAIFISLHYYYYSKSFSLKIIIMGITTSIACQTGDLFISLLKRKAKLKDTGNFLPGHGGILDRLDGILFGIPIGILTTLFIIK
tara:strand:- start:13 stop:663 length:651 start_codon:yes stop_codon:yes gene_type:complete